MFHKILNYQRIIQYRKIQILRKNQHTKVIETIYQLGSFSPNFPRNFLLTPFLKNVKPHITKIEIARKIKLNFKLKDIEKSNIFCISSFMISPTVYKWQLQNSIFAML